MGHMKWSHISCCCLTPQSAVLTAMRTETLSNKRVLLAHTDYILGEPDTEVLECLLELRDRNDRGHFKVIVFLDKPRELDLFNSIRGTVIMLVIHCKKNHPSTSNHECELMLATGTRLPACNLPKVLVNKLNDVQSEIYKHNVKKYEALKTGIKRYSAMEHLTVLELKNTTAWRQYKVAQTWLEDFRTKSGEVGNLENMHTLCVPKAGQLDAFVEGLVKFLTDMPPQPANYKRLLNCGYDLSRPGTTTPQKQEEEHKLHKKRVRTEGLGSARS